MLNDEDHEAFAHLTEAYRDRFGIPLIVSVRDVEKRDQILKTGWERMQNAPTQEFAAAVIEVAKIANHRFDDLVADASPILGARAANLEAADPLSSPTPRTPAEEPSGGVQRFNAMSNAEARETLATCLAVPRWVEDVMGGRPYSTAPEVLHRARSAAADFTDDEIAAALARHPRIGEQAGAGHDAEFSVQEQAAVGDADPTVTEAIRAGNAEYESRFNRVFVIRAAGRPATEILAELRRRLNNTAAAEKTEVVTQLREIALTRLEKVLS
jgi:2-oxo-4-hydroxy-4-carboxy-5-ureidoimidazoline decarboxylase